MKISCNFYSLTSNFLATRLTYFKREIESIIKNLLFFKINYTYNNTFSIIDKYFLVY